MRMWTLNELHLRPDLSGSSGRLHRVTPETARWEYISFDVLRLTEGEQLEVQNLETEACIVLLEGRVDFRSGGVSLGETEVRPNPFDRKPWAMYAPLGVTWRVVAITDSEIAVCAAPAASRKDALFITPEDVRIEARGAGSNLRHVIDLLPAGRDIADRLLVLEAITPSGNSSSYPPHKHDVDDIPNESKLEEVYYHRITPAQGFAFQRVYTADRRLDLSMSVSDRDVVLVPKGYHPVTVPHGYELYYLNVMAGPKRAWHVSPDPDHVWLLNGA